MSEDMRDLTGLRIIASELVPEGKAYLFDPAALMMDPSKWMPITTPHVSFDAAETRFRMAAQFRVSTDAVPEPDPMRGQCLGWLAACRTAWLVVGYEFRKASGRLRHLPAARSCGVITGLTT